MPLGNISTTSTVGVCHLYFKITGVCYVLNLYIARRLQRKFFILEYLYIILSLLGEDLYFWKQNTMHVFDVVPGLVETLWASPNIGYHGLLYAILLAKCFKSRMWENSRHVSRQLAGIGKLQLCSYMCINASHVRSLSEHTCINVMPQYDFGANIVHNS